MTTTTSPPSQGPQAPRRTFYRRSLPDSCTALSSPQGKKLFASAMSTGGTKSFFPLMEQHSTQAEPAYCGITTLTIALNAFAVDPRQTWKGPWRWYEETMLNCCVDLEDIKKEGITMKSFHCLANCQGIGSTLYYVDEGRITVDSFREAVKQACVEDGNEDENGRLSQILIVSYNRKVLGQTGTGHFSPIAAYDAASDSVLIMDTARFKYGVHWVRLPLLFEAMELIDADSGRSRGYIMLQNTELEENDSSSSSSNHVETRTSFSLPLSMLLRTTMKKNAARLKFTEFLDDLKAANGGKVSWESVLCYWTKDCGDPNCIWGAVDPQWKPTPDETETKAIIAQMRILIASLVPKHLEVPSLKYSDKFRSLIDCSQLKYPDSKANGSGERCAGGNCGPNKMRTLDLATEEVIFIFYLASLEEAQREELVRGAADASEEAKSQLLAEAALIHFALQASEELNDSLPATAA